MRIDTLGGRLNNNMARAIVQVKRLWISSLAYGLQFEVVSLEYESMPIPGALSDDGEPELED